MNGKHRNIALFVPHVGCPHRCAFCDQTAISGQTGLLTADDVRAAAQTALADGEKGGEIAFFGGSFTAIDREYMTELLKAAYPYIKDGSFSGIRCSTRPDAIDSERLNILKSYGVSAIELGAQSSDDRVLALNERGHTFFDTLKASAMIREAGIGLGLQMMTGLYGDSGRESMVTAEEFAEIRPDTMRIYPTVVLKNTRLEKLYKAGEYRPQTLDEAAELCARLLMVFRAADIPVIRLGLHSGGNVEENYAAGPYHPAFRELCESRIYLDIMKSALEKMPRGNYNIYVAPQEISKAVGQKRSNLVFLREMGYECKIKTEANIPVFNIDIREIKG